ncbi:MAG: glycogen/starch/alpha-glucan phosphorylase [Succinivibrio sp.]|uniref:Alpha-1,4 glucan phosphorylase n=1 Tax=Succinivibrio faecicola TaxID=2820300 RepID=A0ABS7DFF2_9GAMM|nr:glycogen/starch/alpha-glucan phosphorylase [Succinivibrio faecicola]MBW7569774.1 glycogen/starch/alpha-glucan phosphorylase [Succinivibrio faecicola]MCI6939089.1 glycogen/starch/alpha-glucan phosphorylase [Succinatimonas hippei]
MVTKSTPKKTTTQSNAVKAAPAADYKQSVAKFKDSVLNHLRTTIGTSPAKASKLAWWQAVVAAANEDIFGRLTDTQETHAKNDTRAVHYLSAEFLMGRLTINNLTNLEKFDIARDALKELGLDINEVCEEEPDMALGNGGLGRLAACFMDSLATCKYPCVGYGIHYENGLFRQEIRGGKQVERPDSWREYGSPLEVCRPESIQNVPLGGYVDKQTAPDGSVSSVWHPATIIKGVPWDIPVVGYRGSSVAILRLWESRSTEQFNWDVFNAGGYVDAQAEKSLAETVSKVLYPNDSTEAGKELRLTQQYFFCACSLRDILRRYNRTHHHDYSEFAKKIVIQLNDTHPTIAIPELMRLLIDEEGLSFDAAWDIAQKSFNYTNHTLLPEALEKWPVYIFEKLLPRHLEIIYEINYHFLNDVVEKKWPGNNDIKAKLSIIEEGECRKVRMANLCVITSGKVNGVAKIHSKLVKEDLFPEYAELWPNKFCNVTNGVTPRRWLLACNPGLANIYNEVSGKDWPLNLDECEKLKKFADNKDYQDRFMKVKHDNKVVLAKTIKELVGVDVDPNAMFDVQVKRLHEYKRQHLNLLYILSLYKSLLENPDMDIPAQVFIFGAKAAPAYTLAKDIIYAINAVGDKINNDLRIKGKLKVVFLPNYRVSLAEKIIPAADISEQISTAGYEASGTSNMKFAMNGALTLGTMDGANIEIVEKAGIENNIIFGLSVEEVQSLKANGYNSWDYYNSNSELKSILDWLDTDYFTPGQPGVLSSIKRSLLDNGDPFLVLADFASYKDAHQRAQAMFKDKQRWAKAAMINSATMGIFSSDRSMHDYARDIWNLQSKNVD